MSLCQSLQRIQSDPLGPSASPAVAGSLTHPAETGSSSYGLLVRLQLLPTPPRGDAVTLSYAWRDYHAAGTCTLLTQRPHGRTTAGLRPALQVSPPAARRKVGRAGPEAGGPWLGRRDPDCGSASFLLSSQCRLDEKLRERQGGTDG